jgi:hypothetical protein
MDDLMCESKFEEIDRILSPDIKEYDPDVMLIGLLRITFPVRKQLKEWCPFLHKVKNHFDKKGVDSEKQLTGLLGECE